MNLIALLLPAIAGALLLWWGLGSPRFTRATAALVLLPGPLLGIALSSCTYYVFRLLWQLPSGTYHGIEIALWLLLLAVGHRLFAGAPITSTSTSTTTGTGTGGPTPPRERHARLLLQGLFLLAAIFAATRFALLSLRDPHGGIDAVSIWNLHARFMFFGGPEHWQQITLLKYAQPDYPLLLPAAIARIWGLWDSGAQVAVPAVIALLFSVATVVLLVATLLHFRGPLVAFAAGTLLLGNPLFTEHGASQCADVPLSFFILATFTGLAAFIISNDRGAPNHRFLFFAGICAALTAWTKNEGIPFFILAFLGVIVNALRHPSGSHASLAARALSGRRQITTFLLGGLPILGVITLFKLVHATPNSYSPAFQLHYVTHCIIDPHRYITIIRTVLERFWRFPLAGALLTLCLPLLARRPRAARPASLPPNSAIPTLEKAATTLLLLTLGMAAVYFVIYLVTPQWFDLEWTIDVSCERLFLHLWPSFLLGIALHPWFSPWLNPSAPLQLKWTSS